MNEKLAEWLIAHWGKTGVGLLIGLCTWLINNAYQDVRAHLESEIERNQNQAERIAVLESEVHILLQKEP